MNLEIKKFLEKNKTEIKLFLTFILIFSLFIHWIGWNEYSHLDLTRSIVENGDLNINEYYINTGDRAFYKGNYYSNKPPGLGFLSVPIYSLTNLISPSQPKESGYIPTEVTKGAKIPLFLNLKMRLVLVLLTVFTSCFFTALTGILVYKISKNFIEEEKYSILLGLVFCFGTLAFPYALVYFAHSIGMFFSFLGFYFLFKLENDSKKKYFILSGGLLGFSLVVDLINIPIVVASVLYLILERYPRRKIMLVLCGLIIGFSPFLLYNQIAFDSPLNFPMFNQDPTISFPRVNTLSSFKVIPNLYITLRLLFYPSKGLFFYYPILLLSFIGLFYFYKEEKNLSITVGFIFFIFLYLFSSEELFLSGSSFGYRYFLPMMPFLIIPLVKVFQKLNWKIFIPLILFSIFLNFSGLQTPTSLFPSHFNTIEEAKRGLNSYQVVSNPLFEHYFPLTISNGPRSRVIESFFSPHRNAFDIRDFEVYSSDKYLSFEYLFIGRLPFGLLLFSIKFIPTIIILLIFFIFWRSKLNKKLQMLILLSIVFLFLISFKTSNFYLSGFYPPETKSNYRWFSENATLLFLGGKNRTHLNISIGSYLKPRKLKLYLNKKFVESYRIKSFNETILTPELKLKEGVNKLKLNSEGGCENLTNMENSSDPRCLSFLVRNINKVSTKNLKSKNRSLIYYKNWYSQEKIDDKIYRWSSINPGILLFSNKRKQVKFNLSLRSYYEPIHVDLYLNDEKVGKWKIENKSKVVLTSILNLKKGENKIEFETNKCVNPRSLGGINDTRCLGLQLLNIEILDYKNLVEKNITPLYLSGFYKEEKTENKKFRWIRKNGSILFLNKEPRFVRFNQSLWSFEKERKINISLNKMKISSTNLSENGKEFLTPIIFLPKGLYELRFETKTCDTNESEKRCLSVAVSNFQKIKIKNFLRNIGEYGKNWYSVERDGKSTWRWMSQNATFIIFNSNKAKKFNLSFNIQGYHESRDLGLYLNDKILEEYRIPTSKKRISLNLGLKAGKNLIIFRSPDGCDVPAKIENINDRRCLSFKFNNLNLRL